MKAIILTENKWEELLDQLHDDYPTSVLAISEKTKKVLGFTSRKHQTWIPNPHYSEEMKQYEIDNSLPNILICEPRKGHSKTMIHLDFYSEEKRTFFILKYGEFL